MKSHPSNIDNSSAAPHMRFHLITFGCQMNSSESELIAGYFSDRGMVRAEGKEDADIIVLNTCSVRDHAEGKVLSQLGRLKPFKKRKPGLKIIVTGCMAQRVGNSLRKRFPIVDLVAGAKDIEFFPSLFERTFEGDIASDNAPSLNIPEHRRHMDASITAFVTITRGCENFCSYCIVPYVRGREQSRPAADITTEIKERIAAGSREIMLLGQNVNSYHDGKTGFPDLLRKIDALPGIARVRFMTSHPKDLSGSLIDAMAECKSVCEHLHLPLQSGSDKILAAMNRRYTARDYIAIIDKINTRIPNIVFTTDILVGFPGETDDDFAQTLRLIETTGFDTLYAFKYSPRPGTAAASMTDDVPGVVKEERLERVLALSRSITVNKNAKIIGSVQEVLIDSTREGRCDGRTRGNRKTFFDDPAGRPGDIVNVRIIDARVNTLSGEKQV